jgi:hypothetical protein
MLPSSHSLFGSSAMLILSGFGGEAQSSGIAGPAPGVLAPRVIPLPWRSVPAEPARRPRPAWPKRVTTRLALFLTGRTLLPGWPWAQSLSGALQVHATSPAVPVPRARCRRINRPRSAAARESASDAGKIVLARGEVTHFQFK